MPLAFFAHHEKKEATGCGMKEDAILYAKNKEAERKKAMADWVALKADDEAYEARHGVAPSFPTGPPPFDPTEDPSVAFERDRAGRMKEILAAMKARLAKKRAATSAGEGPAAAPAPVPGAAAGPSESPVASA